MGLGNTHTWESLAYARYEHRSLYQRGTAQRVGGLHLTPRQTVRVSQPLIYKATTRASRRTTRAGRPRLRRRVSTFQPITEHADGLISAAHTTSTGESIGPKHRYSEVVLSSGICADPDSAFFAHTLKTFITSSPRWLMTLTAMRPEAGLSKEREVSLLRVSQASALISALSVVLRDLYGSFAPRK